MQEPCSPSGAMVMQPQLTEACLTTFVGLLNQQKAI